MLRVDSKLASVVQQIGTLPHYYTGRSAFQTVCRIIVGQQLSYSAASVIWARFGIACGSITPVAIDRMELAVLRQCGLSNQKAVFIKQFASRLISKEFSFKRLRSMPDCAAAECLQSIRGFGPWSVEMYLIFGLGRPDVFSLSDTGLRRAICSIYGVSKSSYAKKAIAISDRWRPCRSFACRYLWAWLDNK